MQISSRRVKCEAASVSYLLLRRQMALLLTDVDSVKVVGRGGTGLQPAVNLLENAKDFPKDSLILLITDGWIEDHLTIRRRHAFLLPTGRSLPFRPKGEVFFFS